MDGDWIFLGVVAAVLAAAALIARLRGQDFFKRDEPMRRGEGTGADTSSDSGNDGDD